MIRYYQRIIKVSLKNRSCLLVNNRCASATCERFECERDR